MRARDVLLTLLCVALIAVGQLLFKSAARQIEFHGLSLRSVSAWMQPTLLVALVIYALATLLWVWVLRTAPLSLAYPLFALAFLIVPLIAWALYSEPLTPGHFVGGALVVAGVWLMAR